MPISVSVVRVAIVEEQEVLRRGVVASLADDSDLEIVVDDSTGPIEDEVDVAVVSEVAASHERFACPIVIFGGGGDPRVAAGSGAAGNRVLGTLARDVLTAEQLIAAVRAAAAGLRVDAQVSRSDPPKLNETRLRVLRLLAEGADTREIAATLRYSERTIKGFIQDIEQELGVRNRAHAVAEGIRRGVIVPPTRTSGQEALPD